MITYRNTKQESVRYNEYIYETINEELKMIQHIFIDKKVASRS